MDSIHQARLAQSVEHQTLNRRVVGSNPTVNKKFFILYFVASDALLAGRLAPCKWNQAWRPYEFYMCIEREKVYFKSHEVNCLKECALALNLKFSVCIDKIAMFLWHKSAFGCSKICFGIILIFYYSFFGHESPIRIQDPNCLNSSYCYIYFVFKSDLKKVYLT